MSETTNNFSLLNVEVPDSVNNAAKNLTDLPTKNAGQTLADCWFLVFGGISQMAEKRKIKYALDLETFKVSLEEKISKIPTENLIEARTQIAMPALENSKYCVEEPEIREMFSNLISSSIDNRKSALVHPSFAEILKSMSTIDAQNFMLLDGPLPICDIVLHNPVRPGFRYLVQNLFLMNTKCNDFDILSQSISSLTRLGLIDSNGRFENDAMYEIFENCETYKNFVSAYPNEKIELVKKLIFLTPMGESLYRVCCPK